MRFCVRMQEIAEPYDDDVATALSNLGLAYRIPHGTPPTPVYLDESNL